MRKTKSIFALIALLMLPVISMAQTKNVSIDNVRVPISYMGIPEKPLNPLFFNYTPQIAASKPTEGRISLDEIYDAVRIEGQRKVETFDEADLVVVIGLGNLTIPDSEITQRRVDTKNKEGEITSTTYYYTAVITYAFDSRFKIMKGEEQIAQFPVHISNKTMTYKSKEYNSRKEASDFWTNNREVLISDFTRNLALETVEKANFHASKMHGFRVLKSSEIIKTTNEKKHEEHENFQKNTGMLKDVLAGINAQSGLKKEDVEDIIAYYKSIPQKYTDTKLKADIKLRYAAYYNLSRIHLLLEQTDEAIAYADLLIKNDSDVKDGERLKKDADELKKALGRTKIKTQHFSIEDYLE